ncbi:Utp21 specific WD40 associated putative domain-containing protein [Lineolata rhizophorae]|uniref:Utp21 specific WD40 associated putative domain-containing protein n=1 Tax=Lineolata rhizophorae TaxID=578093 RepID=A0A6A6P2A6_9PEZI|nr:Utp21 specific WD40 associated putative domain-containing protein [Lineolata rhizophorae]
MPSAVTEAAALTTRHDAEPVSKRPRTDAPVEKQRDAPPVPSIGRSKIFAPYRTIGLVSPTSVPFTTLPLGKKTFQITTSVGRALQTYDLRRGLNLVFVTRPQTPEPITATTAWKDSVLAAWSADSRDPHAARGIWVFKRGKKTAELPPPPPSDTPASGGGIEDSNSTLPEAVTELLAFGAWIVAASATRLDVWRAATLAHHATLRPPRTGADRLGRVLSPGCCCATNMPTFLNKVFVGRRDGAVEIWNVATARLVYTLRPAESPAWGGVAALVPSPALSLLAVGYDGGAVVVVDVRADRTLLRFDAGRGGASCISFRTDGLGAGPDGRAAGVMATAGASSGDVALWDLNGGGRKMGVLRGAHNPPSSSSSSSSPASPPSDSTTGPDGGISKIEFLPGQPVLVSSSRDNSLKTWIFDTVPFSPVPRALHARAGHAGPVSALLFPPPESDGAPDGGAKWILSAGGSRDRSLWAWSLRRDGQSAELSQGPVRRKARKMGGATGGGGAPGLDELKAPTITCLACSLNRDGGIGAMPGKQAIWGKGGGGKKGKGGRDAQSATEIANATGWESVVTGHEGDRFARTWFWGRKRAGRWALETGDGADVSSVSVTACGTFAVVGSAGGAIDVFNLQSGLHRQRYPPRLTPKQAQRLRAHLASKGENLLEGEAQKFERGMGRHSKAVNGLAVDPLNRTLMSGGADGKLKFWNFGSGVLEHEISLPTPIAALRYHASADLVAVSGDDGFVRVFDATTKKLVREFKGPSSTSSLSPNKPPTAPSQTSLKQPHPPSSAAPTDFIFSPTAHQLLAAYAQPVPHLRVWDVPSARLVDVLPFVRRCNALAFAATGEYLATAHEGERGIGIWTNTALFAHVPLRALKEAEVDASLRRAARAAEGERKNAGRKKNAGTPPTALPQAPTASGEGGMGAVAAALAEAKDGPAEATAAEGRQDAWEDAEAVADEVPTPQLNQLDDALTTLSLIPRPRWLGLVQLDALRARNRPAQPPKKPEKAPFFLPALEQPGQPAPAASASASASAPAPAPLRSSRISSLDAGALAAAAAARGAAPDALAPLLRGFAGSGDPGPLCGRLAGLAPAAADLAIRGLDPAAAAAAGPGGASELVLFVDALTERLRRRRDYELVRGCMAGRRTLRVALGEWREVQKGEAERLGRLVGFCGGVLGWIRGAV